MSTTSLSLGREALLSSHREEMKEIFDLLDADGSGSIDPKEIRMQMQALGFEADNTTIYQLISDLDGDGSQNLEFEEFLKILKDMQVHAVGYATRDNMQEVFDYLDDLEPQQRDKKIDVTNLQRIAQVLGDNISDAEIEVMIEHADRDGKGFVTAEDFYVLMADEARRMQQQTDAPGSSEPQKKSSQAAKRWKKALISDKVDNVVQEWKISSVEKQEAAASHKQSRSSRVSASDGRAEQRNSHVLLNPSQGGSTSISVRSGSKDTPRKRSPSSSKEAPRARGSSLTVGKDGKKEPLDRKSVV